VVVGIDEPSERRRGAKIAAKGIYRAPVRTSKEPFVTTSGSRGLSRHLLAPLPGAQRVWGLPFLTVLAPAERDHRPRGTRHKTLTDGGRQLLRQVRRWLPDRAIVVVAASTSAVLELLARCRRLARPSTVITRLRRDAALDDPAPPRPTATKGRPRVKGPRPPTLQARLSDPQTVWAALTVRWSGGVLHPIAVATATASWSHHGMPPVPIRGVRIRDPAGRCDPPALLSTPQDAPAQQSSEWSGRRWQLAVTFHEVRAHLGVETQRQWSDRAIRRTTPARLALFALVTLMAHRLDPPPPRCGRPCGMRTSCPRRRCPRPRPPGALAGRPFRALACRTRHGPNPARLVRSPHRHARLRRVEGIKSSLGERRMPVQISVGPPVITINESNTFMVTDMNGEISPDTEQGAFHDDTRYISTYRLFASGKPWVLLSSSPMAYYAARFYLTNQAIPTWDGHIPAGSIALAVSRALQDGLHEDLDVTNHGLSPLHFILELELKVDFADLFEVKSHDTYARGGIDLCTYPERMEARLSYVNQDFKRSLVYRVLSADSPVHTINGAITFEIDLAPGASWHACHHFSFGQGDEEPQSAPVCFFRQGETTMIELHREWQERATQVESANEDLTRTYRQSVEDVGALRLYRYDVAPDIWVPAAGVPWFVTLFGRDSLIVSLQNMVVDPKFARGALWALAQFQAKAIDDWRDAEPGKILHELRVGELAHFHKIPHTPYYGTWDATPLYLIALHEAWKWLGDDTLLRDYREVALGCLEWIDRYGDVDGDGFQEYRTRSPRGYENMGWKDAGDAVVYPDGRQVKQPKALSELQGYVFDAWLRMAEAFDHLGECDRGQQLRRRAADLQARFEEQFWCDDLEFYAYGLDPNKKPIRTIASNPGHCLWSGIASPAHAARVVKRLLTPDMWSGWGVRTLSSENPAYNPFSYQNGSVWPHDNGIIALGFKRYGFADEAAMVAHDVLAAASCFVSYRLPELYAGTARQPGSFPAQYLGANVPQAWAAGCIFDFLRTFLGLQADAPRRMLFVDPKLPDWLPSLTLKGLKIGGDRVDLRVWREGDVTRWEVLATEGAIQVQPKAWEPWRVEVAPTPPPVPQRSDLPGA
jgi:glycogen debranching enzyme